MIRQNTLPTLPVVPHPCAPYGAQGWDSCVLIQDGQQHPLYRFENAFQTRISVVDWSHDGNVLLAGSITGEVLAWQFATGERILANRHRHSYAPICGLSWSPGGSYLVAMTLACTLQIWQVATRECLLVLPCHGRTATIAWSLDGSGFQTDDGIRWMESEKGGRSC